jgi:hypothetical protein
MNMSEGNFYTPNEAKELYEEIVPAYQAAFAGEPWYEVSKCSDIELRCDGGLSPLQVGALCGSCSSCPAEQAYPPNEVTARFDALADSRPTSWYVERGDAGITLAAVAWSANPETIATEKYPDVPEMRDWLKENLGDREVIWLDEVFANRTIKAKGNLRNFGKMVIGFSDIVGPSCVGYRTIAKQMLLAPHRDFGVVANIRNRILEVPDRRDFVTINLGEK